MTERTDSWDRLLDLFHAAADLAPDSRQDFLRSQGASEKTVVEVLELLDRHDRDTGRIDRAPQLPDLGESDRRPDIEGLELLGELGTGGMGTVYRARRTEDFLPDVAVKVIRAGLDGPEILQRFEDERRILAALDHPNICRLLDGGLTADGRPYFVTELVQEALPLHEYCAKHDLGLRDTLRLFVDACRAVHHAHSRLVVHRDLKPSNLLVSSGGTVKLADFGIARVLAGGQEDAELDEATRTELRRLTPEYAAPEQIRGEPISTAVDVYSLGVTLYRLLTGTLPHPRNGRSSAELAHVICTEAPSRPSTRVTGAGSTGTDGPTGPAPSQVARADRPALRGDLDNIVLAALRKDPTRRTPSVLALLEDIEAYLDGRPVRARAPTAVYLVGKFIRRHPFGTAMTAAAALLLILSGALIVRQSRIANVERDRARTEAERSQRVTDAMSQLFELGDPRRNSDVAEMTLAEFTDLAASNALAGLDEDPVTRARVAVSLGRWQVAMYRYAEAAELLDGAIPPLRNASASENELAEALHWSAAAHQNLGDTDLAMERIEEAIALRRTLHGEDDPSVAESLDRRGRILGALNRLDEAASSFRSALDGLGAGISPPTVEMADTLAMLGVTQYRQADYGGAAESMQEALRIYRDLVDPNDWRVGRESGNLGAVLYALGDFRGALAAQQEALRVRSALFESDHPEIALTLSQIGNLERLLGHHRDAIATLDRSRDLRIRKLGAEHPAVALSDLFLGDALAIVGDFARGREMLEEAHRIHLANFPANHPRIVNSLSKIGALELLAGNAERAIPWLRQAIDQHSEMNGAVDLRLAANRTRLGRALLELNRLDEAQTEAEAARAAYAELEAADGLFAADAELLMGDLQCRSDDLDGARATYQRSLEIRRSSLPAGHWRIVEAEARLAELDLAIRPGGATVRTRLTELGDALARSTFAGHPSVRRIRAVLRSAG